MKHKFKFDPKTGTMKPELPAVEQGLKNRVQEDIKEIKANESVDKPVFTEQKQIEIKPDDFINIKQNRIVKMQRVSAPTPIQLVNEQGLPEAYLDSITSGIMMFRERQDYDICQIVDDRSGKVLAYIGGYALQINFNMAELRTMERIEQCLQGLTKLFRHKIMTQTLGKTDTSK